MTNKAKRKQTIRQTKKKGRTPCGGECIIRISTKQEKWSVLNKG